VKEPGASTTITGQLRHSLNVSPRFATDDDGDEFVRCVAVAARAGAGDWAADPAIDAQATRAMDAATVRAIMCELSPLDASPARKDSDHFVIIVILVAVSS
jgi:hypothetical protein